jgi:hypothetical protein
MQLDDASASHQFESGVRPTPVVPVEYQHKMGFQWKNTRKKFASHVCVAHEARVCGRRVEGGDNSLGLRFVEVHERQQ